MFSTENRTREGNYWELKFFELAKIANFYSSLFVVLFGVFMNLIIIFMLISRPSRQKSRFIHRNRSGVPSRSLSSSELYMCALAVVDTLFLISYLLLNGVPSKITNFNIFKCVIKKKFLTLNFLLVYL